MISIAIDAKEKHDVATTDVEGAYLNASMAREEIIHMVYKGDMVNYIVATNPAKYGPYVIITEKGKKLLYVKMHKAICGCIKSALLRYKELVSMLIALGFILTPTTIALPTRR